MGRRVEAWGVKIDKNGFKWSKYYGGILSTVLLFGGLTMVVVNGLLA